ncbi:TauD/TfdA family dioxygenase [Herbaspirillum huttiense F1]|jgi:Probable taurine catabolism dioxygenase|uniref:TauD/TfdA family dioxygenase n=1 Tax=Herbaspirillum huttiense subsp. lycopersici TaxID=3074428 RepID=A0ABU2EI64_9BURK|nr:MULTISPECIES: TauD/TfdA family dioxygenase [Herbaspirillum]MBP1313413.1 alpha-ketoglutarate-dependent taurine dioxygenase [Herbaspirillum sp. 1130]MDR9847840.1 TauD/TfdA family dioxygenase [Herbaspirillum huttiense SE1]MDT0355300.1 TauD/TfdA family dioxygenase [Herbaspirillum huttiense F1]
MNIQLPSLERLAPAGSELPVLITPSAPGQSLLAALPGLQGQIEKLLAQVGAVLLRGFDVPAVEDFRRFAAGFGHPLLDYEFGSTPRSAIGGGVYTTTEYPAHQSIPLHNEQAYTRIWPMKAWFHCVEPAQEGGQTPIADSRAIYRRMPLAIRRRFADGILYVRNYGDFDLPWQKVFNTEQRAEVEAFCRKAKIAWEWKSDGQLRTRQLCQAVETHPVTGEMVWFNQAHLFHVSNLQADVRESLEELLDIEELPRNTYFADGSSIPDAMLAEVREILDAETVSFLWKKGDVMMLDNMLVAHARAPFKGPRKVVVAMAQSHDNLQRDLLAPALEAAV